MQTTILIISPDNAHLGRLDLGLLSTQSLFEMFLEGFQDTSRFKDEHGNYTDVNDWSAVELGEDDDPYHFDRSDDLNCPPLGGSLNLRF